MPDVGDDFRIPITGGANELSQASEATRFKGAPSKDARDAQTCSLGRLRLSAATAVRPCAKTRERQISPAHQRPARPCLLLGSLSSQLNVGRSGPGRNSLFGRSLAKEPRPEATPGRLWCRSRGNWSVAGPDLSAAGSVADARARKAGSSLNAFAIEVQGRAMATDAPRTPLSCRRSPREDLE